ncbi:Bax protein [Limimonas halophila]|uniref:Bax protein n=1 Tax=Limimonas halophila TaxID=1082479 RepID=A0A1G7LPY8_9PROT|nr:glucosaminidase domain-containing protein [Limimonas halophila]SDF51461.1 Bax protein [Limimonas halophila]
MGAIHARRAAPFGIAAGIAAMLAAGPASASGSDVKIDEVTFGHPGGVPSYSLDAVRAGFRGVPRITRSGLPPVLPFVDQVERRKRIFLKSVLPAVLKANADIREARSFLRTVQSTDVPRKFLPGVWRTRLRQMEARYHVEPGEMDKLLRRVDTVPPSLVLAQAALETGWGTSRFAQLGNALFGQHVTEAGAPGMVPNGLDNPGFKVRAFPTLEAAAAAYLHNINNTTAYAELRRDRARARRQGEPLDSVELAGHLTDYSVRGEDYVSDVRATIRANDLRDFDDARLVPGPSHVVQR